MSPVIMLSKFFRAVALFAASFLFVSTALAQAPYKTTLKISTPQEGQTLYGDKVPTLATVENFKLVDYQTNKIKVAGQGHIHLWLDDANPTKESAVKTAKQDFTYSDVPYGNHTLRAELVASDHSSLNPKVTSTVNFKTATVATPSPITTAGLDKNTALVIFVVVAIVIIAAWWYTKEEEEPKTPSRTTKKTSARKKTKKR